MSTPFESMDNRSFWRRSISDRHCTELFEFPQAIPDFSTARIATAGDCFARHIGRNLRSWNMHYLDFEPAPEFLSPVQADKLPVSFGCGGNCVCRPFRPYQIFKRGEVPVGKIGMSRHQAI